MSFLDRCASALRASSRQQPVLGHERLDLKFASKSDDHNHATEVKRMKPTERIKTAVIAQFGRPTGFWGRGAGALMAYRSSNRRRNAWAVSLLDVQPSDRVLEIGLGSVDALPHFDAPFDKILTVNAVLFWNDPDARFQDLRRLLRPGGLIAVAHQPRGPGATDEDSVAYGRTIAAALARAGFSSVRVETLHLKPAVVCALGVNGTSS
jgi:SAM-dependent methyltransferase